MKMLGLELHEDLKLNLFQISASLKGLIPLASEFSTPNKAERVSPPKPMRANHVRTTFYHHSLAGTCHSRHMAITHDGRKTDEILDSTMKSTASPGAHFVPISEHPLLGVAASLKIALIQLHSSRLAGDCLQCASPLWSGRPKTAPVRGLGR